MASNNFVGRGFTEGDLKIASWWVRHEVQIYTWSRRVLYAANILVWLYVAWGLLDAYAISYPRESRLTLEIAANQASINQMMQDRPVSVGTSQVLIFQTTDNRIDIAVDVQNSNKQWWAEFTYKFNVAGEQTTARQGFILPDSLITLTELGFKPKSTGVRTGQLVVEDIRWHRLDPSAVEYNYDQFIDKRFGGVSTENIKFDPASPSLGRTAARTSFDIVNRGAYGFWSIDYVIKLMRGSTVVAVNKVNVRELKPGETRSIDLLWHDSITSVTKTEIMPVINLLDSTVFLPTERF